MSEQGPDPKLLARALGDREQRPWRYYRFEWPDCQAWMDKLLDRALAAEAKAREDAVPLSAIRALIQQWRAEAEMHRAYLDQPGFYHKAAIEYKQRCADQLEALCPAPAAEEEAR